MSDLTFVLTFFMAVTSVMAIENCCTPNNFSADMKVEEHDSVKKGDYFVSVTNGDLFAESTSQNDTVYREWLQSGSCLKQNSTNTKCENVSCSLQLFQYPLTKRCFDISNGEIIGADRYEIKTNVSNIVIQNIRMIEKGVCVLSKQATYLSNGKILSSFTFSNYAVNNISTKDVSIPSDCLKSSAVTRVGCCTPDKFTADMKVEAHDIVKKGDYFVSVTFWDQFAESTSQNDTVYREWSKNGKCFKQNSINTKCENVLCSLQLFQYPLTKRCFDISNGEIIGTDRYEIKTNYSSILYIQNIRMIEKGVCVLEKQALYKYGKISSNFVFSNHTVNNISTKDISIPLDCLNVKAVTSVMTDEKCCTPDTFTANIKVEEHTWVKKGDYFVSVTFWDQFAESTSQNDAVYREWSQSGSCFKQNSINTKCENVSCYSLHLNQYPTSRRCFDFSKGKIIGMNSYEIKTNYSSTLYIENIRMIENRVCVLEKQAVYINEGKIISSFSFSNYAVNKRSIPSDCLK